MLSQLDHDLTCTLPLLPYGARPTELLPERVIRVVREGGPGQSAAQPAAETDPAETGRPHVKDQPGDGHSVSSPPPTA